MSYFIIGADRIIDGVGDLVETDLVLSAAKEQGYSVLELKVANARERWSKKLPPRTFKSACSVMKAIEYGTRRLKKNSKKILVISGEDYVKTGYDKKTRNKLMKIYAHRYTPFDGYTRLAELSLKHYSLSLSQFRDLENALFENYLKTWKRTNPNAVEPGEKWHKPLNKYFRGIDCANPNMDFKGRLLIANEKTSDRLRIPSTKRLRILANSVAQVASDGLSHVNKILPYNHLRRAYNKVNDSAKIDFKDEFMKHNAAMEAYTCYPLVPIAFLLNSGFVSTIDEIPDFLEQYEITITGGLNLARAPWNNTTLNHTIAMYHYLLGSRLNFGLIHGNSSVGYQQGFTLLSRNS